MLPAPTCLGELGDGCTTPAATPPSAVCVVGTTTLATIDWPASSTATALVNVPPTSTPTRTRVMSRPQRGGGGSALRPVGERGPHDEHVQRAEHVHRRQRDLGDERRHGRPDAGRFGEEDRQARPTRAPVGDHVGGLQRLDRVAEERDRGGHHHRDRDVHERAHRQLAPEAEHRERDAGERDEGEADAEQDVAARAPRRTTAATGRTAPSRSPRGTPR